MNHTLNAPRSPKLGKYLGLGWVMAGVVFLFDPFFSLLDILPDALGYLCFFIGLYRLADLDERIMDALKGIRYLALIAVVRLVSLFLAFGLVSPAERPVFVLLVLFTLGLLDCLVLIPLWKNLCNGLLYLGARNGATVMFDRKGLFGRLRHSNMLERYTVISVIFCVLRELLVILPECTVLSHEKGGVEIGEGTRFYDYVGVYRLAGCAVALVLGVIWLVLTVRLLVKLKGDAPFFTRLTEKYTAEVLPRRDIFAMRGVKSSVVCLVLAALCSVDLYLDGVNLLPDVLTAVFLLLSVFFLRPYAGKNRSALGATLGYGLSAALTWFLQLSYFPRNALTDLAREGEVALRWRNMVLLQLLNVLLLLVALGFILRSLYAMVKRYTGVHVLREDGGYAVERTQSIHRILRKKLILVGVFAALTALSTLFFWGVAPILPRWEELSSELSAQTQNTLETFMTMGYQLLTEGYWLLDIALSGLWVVTIAAAGTEISEQMEYSAMMR